MTETRTPAELVESHDWLVRIIAWSLRGIARRSGVDVEDLMQWGHIGLIRAAERFDASQGFEFNTFARHAIRGQILSDARDYRTGGHPRANGCINHVNDFRYIGDREHMEALAGEVADRASEGLERADAVRVVRLVVESMNRCEREAGRLLLKGRYGAQIAREQGFSEGRASQLIKKIKAHVKRVIERDHPSLAEVA